MGAGFVGLLIDHQVLGPPGLHGTGHPLNVPMVQPCSYNLGNLAASCVDAVEVVGRVVIVEALVSVRNLGR